MKAPDWTILHFERGLSLVLLILFPHLINGASPAVAPGDPENQTWGYSEVVMKSLSIMQPCALFIAIGLKTYEIRPWDTRYRGPLLIHASQQWSAEGRELYEKVRAILGPDKDLPDFEKLPRGVILCQVNLESTCRTEEILSSGQITFLERSLGAFSPGRFAWLLKLMKKYDPALPAKGHSGLWDFKGKLP